MGTQDRRIRKTRAVLKNALLSLMKEKSVKHITVKELCDRADINRGTFYLHYSDVFDMLEKIEDDMFSELDEYIEMSEKKKDALSESLFINTFSFVKENSEFCSVMLSDRGEIGFTKIIKPLPQLLGSERLFAYCRQSLLQLLFAQTYKFNFFRHGYFFLHFAEIA